MEKCKVEVMGKVYGIQNLSSANLIMVKLKYTLYKTTPTLRFSVLSNYHITVL